MKKLLKHAAVLAWLACAAISATGQPTGSLARDLVAGPPAPTLEASFTGALERSLPHRRAARAAQPSPLRQGTAPAYTYEHEGARRSVDEYLQRRPVTGLLVLQDETLLLERYARGTEPATRLLSASMAKSVVGLLVGAALAEGRIRSLEDLARDYVPALADNPHGQTSIRDLLTMSSGVAFREQYDGGDDLSALIAGTIEWKSEGGAAVLAPYRTRRVAPGRVFAYSSADTQALALVLAGAAGTSLTEYFASRLWQPMGAEDDASFLIDAAGQEAAFAFMHARLRDFGRLGLLLAREGRALNGRQVIPPEWVRQATRTAAPHLQPHVASSYFGYGHQFWTFPGRCHQFALLGVRGQAIFVDPASRLVLVQTAVWESAGDRAARAELLSLWQGVLAQHGACVPD